MKKIIVCAIIIPALLGSSSERLQQTTPETKAMWKATMMLDSLYKKSPDEKEIDLKKYPRLISIPKGVFKFKNLTSLDIAHTHITEIPGDISGLSKLQELWANDSYVKTLSDKLCELKGLKMLNLNSSKVTKLPENIGSLTSLEMLGLAECKIKVVPKSITKLKNLKEVLICYSGKEFNSKNFPKLISAITDHCK